MVAAKYFVIFIAALLFIATTMTDVSTAMPMPGNHNNNNNHGVAALLVAGALASLLQKHK